MSKRVIRRILPVVVSLAVVGVVVAIVARAVMRPDSTSKPSRITGAVDLAPPADLTPEEQAAAAAGIDPDSGVRLESGAWVEVADPATGRLAQRYSAARVDPLPERWVKMAEPRASFHSGGSDGGGRVVTLRGRSATAHIPRRALESGTITGEVVVQLFRADASGRVDVTGAPALEVHTEEAEFDAAVGQLRCEGDVDVQTPTLRFKGRDLTMLLDQEGRAPERVIVERPVEPIRIDLRALAAERRGAPTASTPAPVKATAHAATSQPRPATLKPPAAVVSSAPVAPARAPSSVTPSAAAPSPMSNMTSMSNMTKPPAVAEAARDAVMASAPAAPAVRAMAVDASIRFYRLTLHDNVHVERRRGGETSTIDGDALSLIFSLDGGGLRSSVAGLFGESLGGFGAAGGRFPNDAGSGAFVGPLPAQIAALTVAAVDDEPAEAEANDELIITYTGRLVMVPATDPADILASLDDTRLEIVGSPVIMHDPAKSVDGRCALLRYDARPERLELVGDRSHALEVDSPRASLRGERLWLIRSTGIGRLEGPGSMRFDERPTAAIDWHGTTVAHGAAPSDSHVVAAIVASIFACSAGDAMPSMTGLSSAPAADEPPRAPKRRADTGAAAPVRPELPLEIIWQEGVDLAFDAAADGGEGGTLREAKFAGAVRVAGEDFAMRSDRLRVGFAQVERQPQDGQAIPEAGAVRPDPQAKQDETSIREIEADGAVHVERLGERGEMDASTMLLTMARSEGKSVPERLVAGGAVAARDANRTIRSDLLTVTFKPKAKAKSDGPGAAARAGESRPGRVGDRIGNVEVGTVLAERDVRVELEDGARVYADRLDGDSLAGKLALAGDDVVIVRDTVVVDGLKDVRFDDATRTVHSPGPGRFRAFEKPVVLPPMSQPGRPALPETAPMRVTWSDSFRYDDKATTPAGTSGEIHLVGTVDARSEPNAKEIDTLASRELRLGLKDRPSGDVVPASEAKSGGAKPGSAKEVATMTATGDAVLESQRWPEGVRGSLPQQLFRVRGESVRYTLATREAAVDGAGQILLHDVSPPKPGTEGKTGFGSRGMSTFTWKGRMEMSREDAERYTIVLVDGVEVAYAGTRLEDTLTLTADRLEITLRRGAAGAAEGQKGSRFAGIDLGGGGEILRIRAVGKVFIRAPEQDVDTHEFDYNPSTGIAELRGNTQRQVQVVVKGSPQPLRADSMRWDMREGRVLIERADGSVGR